MLDRAKNTGYQGKVDHSLFNRHHKLVRKTKWSRCSLCNKDVESIFPSGTMVVSERTFLKLWEVFKHSGARFEIIKREHVVYPINYVIDEFTMKPINGVATHVDLDVCRNCLAKIGARHKFSRWQERARFVTSQV